MRRFFAIFIIMGLHYSLAAVAQEDSWVSVATMPTARESVAACAVNDLIYAVGGFPGGSDQGITTNERFDPASGTWSTMAPMLEGRRMPVTGVVNDRCYVIGGRITDGRTPQDDVQEYDPATDSWRTRASMPTKRFAHAAAVIDGIIYVVGGTDGRTLFATLEAYDPATDSWTTLSPMAIPRALHAAAASGGKLYVMGGSPDGESVRYSSLEIYDPVSGSWTRGSDMPIPKFSLTASTANGRIYAIGGADGPVAINDVAEYDPASDSWREVSPMLTPRARFASAVVNDRIYAIGGTTSFGNPHFGMSLVEQYTPAAAGFSINPGLNDAWYDPLTSGQGFLISVLPDSALVFVAWFTYDTQRPPEDVAAVLGEPGHRWLTAQGSYSGHTANLTISNTAGGVFNAAQPAAITDPVAYGVMTIEFADCEAGLVSYEIASLGISGEIPIERIVADNVGLCEALAAP